MVYLGLIRKEPTFWDQSSLIRVTGAGSRLVNVGVAREPDDGRREPFSGRGHQPESACRGGTPDRQRTGIFSTAHFVGELPPCGPDTFNGCVAVPLTDVTCADTMPIDPGHQAAKSPLLVVVTT